VIIYDLEKEALPLLVSELNVGLNVAAAAEQVRMFCDLICCRLFVEEAWDKIRGSRVPGESSASSSSGSAFSAEYFELVALLIPPKILERSRQQADFAENFCAALNEIDRRLRRDWDKSFFEFFLPPAFSKIEVTAFEGIPKIGRSSYTVLWPAFSQHQCLIDTLGSLARDTGSNPLSGGRLGRPVSLEAELIASLRRESDQVRDLLSIDGVDKSTKTRTRPREAKTKPRELASPKSAYHKPDPASLADFMQSMNGDERAVIESLLAEARDSSALREKMRESGTSNADKNTRGFEMLVDNINAAFERRFGDLLIESNAFDNSGYSISAEYGTILSKWKSPAV
jgi:hypothetical protein